jgi:hypothetical protein
MIFTIVPYLSVGPLYFGDTVSAVIETLGEPIRRSRNARGETDLQFGDCSVRFDAKDHILVEVGFSARASVRIGDIDVFTSQTALTDLITAEGCEPFEYAGFLIFPKLGITLTGMHDGDQSQLALTAFAKGRWDHLRTRFEPT